MFIYNPYVILEDQFLLPKTIYSSYVVGLVALVIHLNCIPDQHYKVVLVFIQLFVHYSVATNPIKESYTLLYKTGLQLAMLTKVLSSDKNTH